MTRTSVSKLWCAVACLLVATVTCDDEKQSTPVRVPRFVTPLSRVDGLTFANSLNYKGPGSSFSTNSFSFNQPSQFNTPVVFPPHSPTAHLTPYSVYLSPSARPTSPIVHAAQGVSNFLSKSELAGPPTIHRLPPVAALHNVPVHNGPSLHSGPSLQSGPSLHSGPLLHSGPSLQSGGYNSISHNAQSLAGGYGPPPVSKECGGYNTCVPLVSCASCFEQLSPNDKCALYGGEPGVCCPPTPKPTGPAERPFQPPNFKVKTPDFSVYQLNEAAKHGLWQMAERDQMENTLQARGITVSNSRTADDRQGTTVSNSRTADYRQGTTVSNSRTADYRHLQFFKTSPRAMRFGRAAITVERSTSFLMYRYDLTPLQAGFGLRRFSVGDTILQDTCPQMPSCGEKEEYYRTIDASCNNLRNPTFGQAKTGLQRILPPHYEDGIYEPRGGRDNSRLPSARVVSVSNVADVDSPDLALTLSVMQWGQFIDHDLTHVPIFRLGNETGIQCCNDQGRFTAPPVTHPACLPIAIPADDPFFAQFGRRCMNFVRSMPTQGSSCTFGFTEQMNQVTHFLDGSNVYGSSVEEEQSLRLGRGGLLNVQGRALLPADPNASEDSCGSSQRGFHCFMAGDNRVNEHTDLTVIQTIWMREHNRLALQLAKINPHWDDETLYQEARRIVVAQMQHIVYNEWLPLIIGKECMVNNDILPRREGYSRDYNPAVNAAILNEFSAAAFRFGHSLVQGMRQLFGKNHQQTDNLELRGQFNSPHLLYTPGKLDEFLRGLAKQPIQKLDNFVSEQLTNRLFQGDDMPFGLDLVSLNIQRGRDHGIPPYNDLREACGLPRARTFEDLLDVLPAPVVQRLSGIYASVDDIDLFVAGIAERAVPGAIMGPTFKCILTDQFAKLRRGDRFFYEHGGMQSSFTEAQLQEIRSSSWARIMCDNGDHITAVQPLAMRTIGPLNPKVSCDSPSIPSLDLTPWISIAD